MKKLIPLVCILTLLITFQSCKKKSQPPNVTVTVGGLFATTGNGSSLGITSKAAMQLAIDDINAYLARNHANFHMAGTYYNTKLDPNTTKQDFNDAKNNDIHFIIGPQTSSELAAIKPLADNAQIIVISQGSTAGSLAIAGDAIFRFCPSDKVEGEAMGASLAKSGLGGLVTVARNDAGNLGLQTAIGNSFAAHGGKVMAIAPYDVNTTDFTGTINAIKIQAGQFAAVNGFQYTGVYIASFDEGVQLLHQVANDNVLIHTKWYGGDGITLSAALIADTTAAKFAKITGFFAPSFGLPLNLQSKWQPVAQRIQAKTGLIPNAFALSVYDAVWVIAHSLEAKRSSSFELSELKTLFVNESNSYTGITGSTALDSAGDRAAGTYDYFGITQTGAAYNWNLTGESD